MTDPTEPRRIRVGGLDMAVVVDGAGPDLVLLHGGGDGPDGMEALQRMLAPGRRIIAPEQRGHGRTPDAGDLRYAAMADDTCTLLDALSVASADLVGWSDGGVLALMVARDRPDLVRRVVAIGANVAIDSKPPPLAPAALAEMRSADPAEVPMPMAVETRRRLFAMWLAGPELTLEDLSAIQVPVLFISADRDVITLDHTVAMFRALPQAQLAVIPKAEHDVPRTMPDVVAGLIETFLRA